MDATLNDFSRHVKSVVARCDAMDRRFGPGTANVVFRFVQGSPDPLERATFAAAPGTVPPADTPVLSIADDTVGGSDGSPSPISIEEV